MACVGVVVVVTFCCDLAHIFNLTKKTFDYNGQAFFWYSIMHILYLGEMIN